MRVQNEVSVTVLLYSRIKQIKMGSSSGPDFIFLLFSLPGQYNRMYFFIMILINGVLSTHKL